MIFSDSHKRDERRVHLLEIQRTQYAKKHQHSFRFSWSSRDESWKWRLDRETLSKVRDHHTVSLCKFLLNAQWRSFKSIILQAGPHTPLQNSWVSSEQWRIGNRWRKWVVCHTIAFFFCTGVQYHPLDKTRSGPLWFVSMHFLNYMEIADKLFSSLSNRNSTTGWGRWGR